MKLLLIQALDDAHLYSQFNRALREALLEIGCDAAVAAVPLGRPDILLAALTAGHYDAAISFSSGFGDASFSASGQSMFDALDVKFVGWQFDHPIYVHHALSPPMAQRHSIYPNTDHRRFSETIGVSGRGRILLPGARAADGPPKPYRRREGSVFIAATWNDVPERVWDTLEDSPAKWLYSGVVERLVADPHVSVLNAFQGAASDLSLPLRLGADPELDGQLINLLRASLSYVRHMDRLNAIGALVDAGLPVTLCGSGWRDHLGERRNLTVLDSVRFDALPALYGNAQVVLNLNAANGGSERAFHAMMAGAAVVSDPGDTLAAAFAADEEIAFFDRTAPESLAKVAGDLLQSDQGEAMAHAGHAKAMASALWRHRAEDLVQWLR